MAQVFTSYILNPQQQLVAINSNYSDIMLSYCALPIISFLE